MKIAKHICLLLLVGSTLWAQVEEVLISHDKQFGEEEQIEARRDWFRNQRGLGKVDPPRPGPPGSWRHVSGYQKPLNWAM